MKESRQITITCRHILAGVAVGIVAYGAALLGTMALAPRVQENVRSVVALPWPLYAALPSILAMIFGLFISTRFARCGQRIAIWVAVGLTVSLCSAIGIALLRRDFLGEF